MLLASKPIVGIKFKCLGSACMGAYFETFSIWQFLISTLNNE